MDYVKIGGKNYNCVVTEISEYFNILYSDNTGRTMAQGRMTLDPLGTFYGHKVVFKRKQGFEQEYDSLFELLSKPRYSGIPVELVHGQETLKYEAYVSNGERALKRIDPKTGVVYWGEFSVNFIPMEAQVVV
jgi:hypothetical protein